MSGLQPGHYSNLTAPNKYNKIISGIYLVFYSAVVTMLHGPLNIIFSHVYRRVYMSRPFHYRLLIHKTMFTAVSSPDGDTVCCLTRQCSERTLGLKCDNFVVLVESTVTRK